MGGPKWITPAIFAVLIAATAGLWLVQAEVAWPSTPDSAEIAELQTQASEACRCGRRLGDPWNGGCWAEFNRHRDRFRYSEIQSACAEESVALTCFGGPGGAGERCVNTQWPYGGCDHEESRRLKARAATGSGCGD